MKNFAVLSPFSFGELAFFRNFGEFRFQNALIPFLGTSQVVVLTVARVEVGFGEFCIESVEQLWLRFGNLRPVHFDFLRKFQCCILTAFPRPLGNGFSTIFYSAFVLLRLKSIPDGFHALLRVFVWVVFRSFRHRNSK